jgi:hypothetical protein
MKINDPRHPWVRLVQAARAAPDTRGTDAPYGFATRMAGRALSGEGVIGSLIERFALRAVGIAGLLAVASVIVNLSALGSHESFEEDALPAEEPALVLLGD